MSTYCLSSEHVHYCIQIQNQIHGNQLRRAEQEARHLQEQQQVLTNQNKTLHAELQQTKRKQAEIECKVRII